MKHKVGILSLMLLSTSLGITDVSAVDLRAFESSSCQSDRGEQHALAVQYGFAGIQTLTENVSNNDPRVALDALAEPVPEALPAPTSWSQLYLDAPARSLALGKAVGTAAVEVLTDTVAPAVYSGGVTVYQGFANNVAPKAYSGLKWGASGLREAANTVTSADCNYRESAISKVVNLHNVADQTGDITSSLYNSVFSSYNRGDHFIAGLSATGATAFAAITAITFAVANLLDISSRLGAWALGMPFYSPVHPPVSIDEMYD